MAISCGNPGKAPEAIIDSAFARTHPGLATAIRERSGKALSGGGFETIGLDSGPAGLLESARRMGFGGGAGTSPQAGAPGKSRLVTSPLFALALIEGEKSLPKAENRPGIDALGGALLIVPEWQGLVPDEIIAVRSDFTPAFGSAGRAMGDFVALLAAQDRMDQGEPQAAILFRPGPARGREALEAFTAACEGTSGSPPLVRELPEGESAEELDIAVKALLAQDIRIVLVAIGRGTGTACQALSRPGLVLGAETSQDRQYPEAAFRIVPDNATLAELLSGKAEEEAGGTCLTVPARLEALPSSSSISAGGKSLSGIIGDGSGQNQGQSRE